jgi:hypothetical protein
MAVSSASAGDIDFRLTNDSSLTRYSAAVLRPAPKTADPLAVLIPDNRAEVRGGKPTIAYTVFRLTSRSTDFSLQPVIGQINGAQVQLNF